MPHAPARLAQRRLHVGAGGLQRRREAEQQGRRERGRQRERRDSPIHRDGIETRQSRRSERQDRADRPARDEQAARAARQRQQQTLGQELARQPGPPRAERRPYRQFARTGRGAREQQVRDVRAGDEQHEGHRAEQQVQRRPGAAGDLLPQRHDRRAFVCVAQRIGGREPRGDRPHLAPGLCQRDAWRQPGDHAVIVGRSRGRLGDRGGGEPDVGPRREAEAGRHHAHDRIRLPEHRDRAAQSLAPAVEPAQPEVVGDDGGGRPLGPLLPRAEQPPEPRRDAEHVEELPRDH